MAKSNPKVEEFKLLDKLAGSDLYQSALKVAIEREIAIIRSKYSDTDEIKTEGEAWNRAVGDGRYLKGLEFVLDLIDGAPEKLRKLVNKNHG